MHVLFVCSLGRYHLAARKYVSRLSLITYDENLLRSGNNDSVYDKLIPTTQAQIRSDYKYLSELAAGEEPIDMVISIDEEYSEAGIRIARFLNVPFSPEPEVVLLVNNKLLTRKALKEHGLDNLPAQVISSVQQAREFISINGCPIVLKPLDSSGSSGVTKIDDSGEINEALNYLQHWAAGRQVLAEKFVDGKEFSVEAFSEKGTHHAICVVEKFKSDKHFVGQGHRLPAPIGKALEEKIVGFVKDVLTALNIQSGPTHSEVIVSNDGKEIVLVETHLRAGGAKLTTLIHHIWNINVVELWARQLFTGETVLPTLRNARRQHNCAVVMFHTPPFAGVLQQIDAASALKVPGIIAAGNFAPIGSVLTGYAYNSGTRAGYAIALGNDPDSTLEFAKEAVQKIQFSIKPI
jgi:biotin carboxylase